MSESNRAEKDVVTIGEIRANKMAIIEDSLQQFNRCVRDLRISEAKGYLAEIERCVVRLQELDGMAVAVLVSRPTKIL
jgi:hypothetical protein